MNHQERQVALVTLAVIALGAFVINFAKPGLGHPGLAMERRPLTNELGAIVREERVRLPAKVAGFHSKDAPITSIELATLPPDTSYGRKLYWDEEGFGAQMSAVLMKTDRTSIHKPQICITGGGWKIQKTDIIDIPVASPSPYVLKATCLTCSKMVHDPKTEKEFPHSAIYIYWFVSERRLLPSHSEVLWAISHDLVVSGILYPWAYVSCYAEFPSGREAIALVRMKRLISEAAPEFQLTPPNPKQSAFLQNSLPLH